LAPTLAYTLAYYFDWSLFQYYVAERALSYFALTRIPPVPRSCVWLAATAALAGAAHRAGHAAPFHRAAAARSVWLVGFHHALRCLMYELRWFL